MNEKILVTGSTGKAGRELVRILSAEGRDIQAGTRSPARARELFGPGMEVVEFDYERAETYDAAVHWADRLFLVPPPFDPDAYETLLPFLDWAVSAGIDHIVLLSAMAAERLDRLALRKVEKHIEGVGVAFTFLRPNIYMGNFASEILLREIRDRGSFSLPADDGRVSYVDVGDVAAVAAAALQGEEHHGCAYTLTGPVALDGNEVAAILSQAAGRAIRYRAVEDESLRRIFGELNWPANQIEVFVKLFGSIREGWRAPVSRDVSEILGRPPRTFELFARENAGLWGMG